MGYFREIPNIEYQSPFQNRISNSSYVTAKNLFRRMKIRDDLQNIFTVFDKYEIKDGFRPDNVAEEIYGKSNLDWVVILSSGITNIRNQWPLSNRDLYKFVENKYGLKEINEIHHYETKEIKDREDKLILPAGQVVDSNFSISYREVIGYDSDNDIPIYSNPITPSSSDIVTKISNYEYETIVNHEKASIYILKRSFLQQFLTDIRNEMTYKRSSQYVNDNLIRTENTRTRT